MIDRKVIKPRRMVQWCHGLAMLDEMDDVLQFTHSSIKDFLCGPAAHRDVLSGFQFQLKEANREMGVICVTYLNFIDFETQLIKTPKQSDKLDPIAMANQVLGLGTSSTVMSKVAGLVIRKASCHTISSSLVSSRGDTNTKAQTPETTYHFLQYASAFWLAHTPDLSETQPEIWHLWKLLVEGHKSIVELPWGETPARFWDGSIDQVSIRRFMLITRHQALLNFMMPLPVGPGRRDELDVLLTGAIRQDCVSFVEPMLQRHQYPQRSSWLHEAMQEENNVLIGALLTSASRDEWIAHLTTEERSDLYIELFGSRKLGYIRMELQPTRKRLIDCGINIFQNLRGHADRTTLLEMQIRKGEAEDLYLMCTKATTSGADLDIPIPGLGRNALHLAATHLRPDAIRAILAAGASVNARDEDQRTALHLALAPDLAREIEKESSNDRVLLACWVLLEAGADPDLKDNEGKVALDYVTYKKLRKGVEKLYREREIF